MNITDYIVVVLNQIINEWKDLMKINKDICKLADRMLPWKQKARKMPKKGT